MTGVNFDPGRAEVDMVRQVTPALFRARGFDALETQTRHGRTSQLRRPYSRILDCAARSERAIVWRCATFVRGHGRSSRSTLYGAADAGLETSEDPMEILIFPHPPQGSPPLLAKRLRHNSALLKRNLGRWFASRFATTGLQESEEGNVEPASNQAKPAVAPPAPPLRVETAVVETPACRTGQSEPHRVETARGRVASSRTTSRRNT